MSSPAQSPEFIRFVVETYKDDFNGYRADILGMKPAAWQDRVGASVMENKRTIVSAGHGIGKTGLAASAIHWFAATRPRFAIVATANTEDQLKKKLWRELAKINDGAKNKDWFKWDTSTFTRFGDPTTQAIALPNNENNPGAFAGTHEDHVLGVFEEAAEIARPIWNVFNGAMTTAGARWLAISNPRNSEGYFYDAAFGKLKARKPGDNRRLWTSFVVPSFDSPFVDPDYVETMRENLGEQSDEFLVQVLGLPPKSTVQQFLSRELVTKAMERTVPTYERWPLIIGADVGRGDRSVLVARRGRKVSSDILILEGERTTDFARRIRDEIKLHREESGLEANVIIEELGMGVGVVESLQDWGFDENVWGVNTGESASQGNRELYTNLRCEMWGELKDWLEGDVELPNNQALYDDLVQIKKKSNGNSALRLETKEEMRRRGVKSPDVGDALALTFAVEFDLLPERSKRDRWRDDDREPATAGSWASM
jgi:hypothetical protein